MLIQHALEQPHAEVRRRRYRRIALRVEDLDARALQAIGLHTAREDAKARLARRDDMEKAELWHVLFDDLGEGTGVVRRCRRADFLAFADGADAEGRAVAQAGFQHLDIALLEDAKRQPSAGKEHGVQRKERELVYGSASCASARWRTSTRQSSRNALASSSAR